MKVIGLQAGICSPVWLRRRMLRSVTFDDTVWWRSQRVVLEAFSKTQANPVQGSLFHRPVNIRRVAPWTCIVQHLRTVSGGRYRTQRNVSRRARPDVSIK